MQHLIELEDYKSMSDAFHSQYVWVDGLLTMNTVLKLNPGQERAFARKIKRAAEKAWHGSSDVWFPEVHKSPFAFHLETLVAPEHPIPDADAFTWVGKWFLDMAVKAGLLVDDGPKYVVSSTCHVGTKPLDSGCLAMMRSQNSVGAHRGVLVPHYD